MSGAPPYPEGTAALAAALEQFTTQHGKTLPDLASSTRVLVVFLRHAGCTFCRQTLSDLAASRERLEREGIRIVLVHMGDVKELEHQIERYCLASVDRICDPDRVLYQAFGLKRGRLRQLFGWKVLWRGFQSGLLGGHGFALPRADSAQMPGVFLLEECGLTGRLRHRSPADRPDYLALCGATREKNDPQSLDGKSVQLKADRRKGI